MKKLFFTLFISLFLYSSTAFSNGLSLNSIGARALGMGGAMVGLANDYTTIYWNPAGLRNLDGTYVGVFFTGINPMGTYKVDLPTQVGTLNIDTETESNIYPTGGLIGHWQCLLTEKMTIGLGVYVPAGLGAEWNGTDLAPLSGGSVLNWESQIGLINFSPSAAYQVTDQFSLGLAVNIYYAMFDLSRPADMSGLGLGFQQYKEESTGLGYGVTLGAFYKINEMISAGASFRTKADVTMDGEATNPGFGSIPASFGGPWPTKSDFERDVSWPMWIAGGVAVKPAEGLTLALDVQYSQWSESEKEFTTKYDETTWQQALEPTDDHKFILKWKDATQIRFGAEYMLNDMVTVRGGFYTDPAPAPDETYNIIFPSIDYNAVTGGASFNVSGVNIDVAAEYLMGSEREIALGAYEDAMPGKHNMNIFAFSVGAGFAIK